MDELMDLMATDESPSQISDKLKDILFTKSAERVDNFRPEVATGVFDSVNSITQSQADAVIADEGGEE
jgi:hypothetical protein|tara:strand:- start:363 stop:566 length:204 start_codon:yes stop_codon:yes gene_type:complete